MATDETPEGSSRTDKGEVRKELPTKGSAGEAQGRETKRLDVEGGQPSAESGSSPAADSDSGSSSPVDNSHQGAESARAAGKTAEAAQGAQRASKALDGVAASAAGSAARQAVEGKGDSAAKRAAGRYAGAAASGAVAGAQAGSAPGAAIGAAKNVGLEAAKDGLEGVSDVTGGGPETEQVDEQPADGRLGAGGTSFERGGGQKDDRLMPKAAKVAAVGGTAAATPGAMAIVMMMALLKWLKSMFFAAAAFAANAANAFFGFLLGVAKTVGTTVAAPFMALGGVVANVGAVTFGITAAAVAPVTAVASGVAASVAAFALVGTLITGIIDSSNDEGRQESSSARCIFVGSGAAGDGANVSANAEENAKLIYSTLSTWGMPDENIAGILGNWSQESGGMDPTAVESIFDEPYRIGPRKQAAWDGGFTHIPGQTHGGIGLAQWSNGRTPRLLAYTESKNLDWHTVEAQMAFLVEGDNPADAAVVQDMLKNSLGSPSAAAHHFHDNWERSADTAAMAAERAADAEMWFAKMSGWEVDSSLVGGINDIIGDLVDSVTSGINTLLGNCGSDTTAGPVGDLSDGGMTEAEGQALVDLYNDEGDQVLRDRFKGGGPGQCNGSYVENCVSFSWYFMIKYASYTGGYVSGNGRDVAGALGGAMGRQTSNTPTAYSIFSHGNSSAAGHTGVVLAVKGDQILIGEAAYCAFPGRVRWVQASEWRDGGWEFLDVSDKVGSSSDDPADVES